MIETPPTPPNIKYVSAMCKGLGLGPRVEGLGCRVSGGWVVPDVTGKRSTAAAYAFGTKTANT